MSRTPRANYEKKISPTRMSPGSPRSGGHPVCACGPRRRRLWAVYFPDFVAICLRARGRRYGRPYFVAQLQTNGLPAGTPSRARARRFQDQNADPRRRAGCSFRSHTPGRRPACCRTVPPVLPIIKQRRMSIRVSVLSKVRADPLYKAEETLELSMLTLANPRYWRGVFGPESPSPQMADPASTSAAWNVASASGSQSHAGGSRPLPPPTCDADPKQRTCRRPKNYHCHPDFDGNVNLKIPTPARRPCPR